PVHLRPELIRTRSQARKTAEKLPSTCWNSTARTCGVSRLKNARRCSPSCYAGAHLSITLNEHFEEDGALVYDAACQLGCEGIVSKRLGSPYRPGPVASLAEGQKSESASGEARGRGRLGALSHLTTSRGCDWQGIPVIPPLSFLS